MKTVYLVVGDEFYDGSVAGVFSSHEKAVAYIEARQLDEHYQVERYIVDPGPNEDGVQPE